MKTKHKPQKPLTLARYGAILSGLLLSGYISLAAQEKPVTEKKPWSDRDGGISLWGGYTPLLFADGIGSINDICKSYTKSSIEDCARRIGGYNAGLDLWAGKILQFGLSGQYYQAANYDVKLKATAEVPTAIPGQSETVTVKSAQKLRSHFIPVLAQARFYPQFFYVGLGAGMAFNISEYEATYDGKKISKSGYSAGNGFFAQATAGLVLPLGERASVDLFVKGSMLSNFVSAEKKSNGTISYYRLNTVSAYGVTPGLAVSFVL